MHFSISEGYIFLKLQGNVDRNADGFPNENEYFDYRIGTNSLLKSFSFNKQLIIDEATEIIEIDVDVLRLLENIDMQQYKDINQNSNFSQAILIADNILNAFTLQ